eukprot:TRINITY_DN27566_c0_g1_i2.p1 TRINITY_DN27566_c0_g1~~TRINITY_DN27566_c0_g1_i2.p1  ORF type:complete len:206 (-),score=31.07 TRINITY_DN27566_c0_g1_i2:143-760(-)
MTSEGVPPIQSEAASSKSATGRKRDDTPPPQARIAATISGEDSYIDPKQTHTASSGKDFSDAAKVRRERSHDAVEHTDGRRHRLLITMALFASALVLILGPAGYCWLKHGRAQLADEYRGTAHWTKGPKSDTGSCHTCKLSDQPISHHVPALYVGRDFVNEVASGGINGLLMMVATVLGGIGADIPGRGIFAMGTARHAGVVSSE